MVTATEDASLLQGSPTATGATGTSLFAGYSTSTAIKEGYAPVKFDLSAIPAGSTITAATLTLTANAAVGTPTIAAYRVTSSWTEGVTTWDTRPTFSTLLDSKTLSTTGTVTFDGSGQVTQLVQNWFSGLYTNHGVLLKRSGTGTLNSYAMFNSRENTGSKPTLTVSYNPPPTVPSFAIWVENDDIVAECYAYDVEGQQVSLKVHVSGDNFASGGGVNSGAYDVSSGGLRTLRISNVFNTPNYASPDPRSTLLASSKTLSARLEALDSNGNKTTPVPTATFIYNAPSITAISPPTAGAGVQTNFTLTGTNLITGMGFAITGATGIEEQPGGTSNRRDFLAVPASSLGTKAVVIKTAPGGTVVSNNLSVNVVNLPPVVSNVSMQVINDSMTVNCSISDPEGGQVRWKAHISDDNFSSGGGINTGDYDVSSGGTRSVTIPSVRNTLNFAPPDPRSTLLATTKTLYFKIEALDVAGNQTLPTTYTYSYRAPQITSIAPSAFVLGDGVVTLTISGINLNNLMDLTCSGFGTFSPNTSTGTSTAIEYSTTVGSTGGQFPIALKTAPNGTFIPTTGLNLSIRVPLPAPTLGTAIARTQSIEVPYKHLNLTADQWSRVDKVTASIRDLATNAEQSLEQPKAPGYPRDSTFDGSITFTGLIVGHSYRIGINFVPLANDALYVQGGVVLNSVTTQAVVPPVVQSFTATVNSSTGDIACSIRCTDSTYTGTGALLVRLYGSNYQSFETWQTTVMHTENVTGGSTLNFTIPASEARAVQFLANEDYRIQARCFNPASGLSPETDFGSRDSATFTYYDPSQERPVERHYRGDPASHGDGSLLWKGVDVTNGNRYFARPLMRVDAEDLPFDFIMFYNSVEWQSAVGEPGLPRKGTRWKNNWEQWVYRYQSTYQGITATVYKVLREDGTVNTFFKATDGKIYSLNRGYHDQLYDVAGHIVLGEKNRWIFDYGNVDASGIALLQSVSNNHGKTITITYETVNGQKRINYITDTCGKVYDFAYSGPNTEYLTVTDYAGNFVLCESEPVGSTLRLRYATDTANRITEFQYEPNTEYVTAIIEPRLMALNNGTKSCQATYYAGGAGAVATTRDARNNVTSYFYNYLGEERTRVVPPDATRTTDFYLANGRVVDIREGTAATTQTTFGYQTNAQGTLIAASGNLVSFSDWQRNESIFTRNPNGDLTKAINRLGKETNITNITAPPSSQLPAQSNFSAPTGITDPLARVTSLEYDPKGEISKIISPQHQADQKGTSIITDANGFTQKVTDLRGATQYEVITRYLPTDSVGRCMPKVIKFADEAQETFERDALGRLTRHLDKRGFGTDYTYDDANQVTDIIEDSVDLLGHTGKRLHHRYEYDGNGNVAFYYPPKYFSEGNNLAYRVAFSYDFDDHPTGVQTSLNQVSSTFDSMGRLETQTSGTNATSTLIYGSKGYLEKRANSTGKGTTITTDNNGNVTGTTDADGKQTITVMDKEDHVIAVKSLKPDGSTSHGAYFKRDTVDRIVETATYSADFSVPANTDTSALAIPAGHHSRRVLDYDLGDRITQVTEQGAAGSATAQAQLGIAYNDDTSYTDPEGVFAPMSRIQTVTITPPLGVHHPSIAGGNVMTVLSNRNLPVLEEVRSTPSATPAITRRQFDEDGRVTALDLPGCRRWDIEFSYDSLGLLEQRKVYNADGTVLKLQTWTHDEHKVTRTANSGDGILITVTPDALNRPVSITTRVDGIDYTLGVQYNGNSQITQLTYPTGLVVNYDYDSRDRPWRVRDSQGHSSTSTFHENDTLDSVSHSNGSSTQMGFDHANRLALLSNFSQGLNSLSAQTISTRDARDMPLTLSQSSLPLDVPLSQLTSGTRTFTYQGGASGYTELVSDGLYTYQHNARGQVSSITGATITTLGWNALGERTSLSKPGHNETDRYDTNGLRTTQTINGVTIITVWNPVPIGSLPEPIYQKTGTKETCYVWDTQGLNRMFFRDTAITSAWTVRFYHFDLFGNTIALTDENGRPTDFYGTTAFGEATVHDGATDQPFIWGGRYGIMNDGSGFYYARARYIFGPSRRFISLDPVAGSLDNLQTFNRYSYAANNPLGFNDASGREIRWLDVASFLNTARETLLVWAASMKLYKGGTTNHTIGRSLLKVNKIAESAPSLLRGISSAAGPVFSYFQGRRNGVASGIRAAELSAIGGIVCTPLAGASTIVDAGLGNEVPMVAPAVFVGCSQAVSAFPDFVLGTVRSTNSGIDRLSHFVSQFEPSGRTQFEFIDRWARLMNNGYPVLGPNPFAR
ncbi:MAG: DNRLRE domain-containing protein [Verrucomicrobiaceae bacterium]|nr:DNRLRE domain-containing protein [Verrucomicrobiaceae bacterium]